MSEMFVYLEDFAMQELMDIKLASESIAMIIIVWEVSEEYTGSDYL